MDQEKQIIEKYESMNKKFHKKTCRIRGTVYPQVEEALILWMKQMRSNKIPLSGDLIKCKANEFAKKMNIDNLSASDGYLRGLKKRNSIAFINERGESDSVNSDKVENWKNNLNEIINNYDSNEIYNCDETGMFWRLLPNKTFSFEKDSRKGIKKSHDRVTVLLITNMNGNDKDIFIIGKSQNPICFRSPKDEDEAKNISKAKQIIFNRKILGWIQLFFKKSSKFLITK